MPTWPSWANNLDLLTLAADLSDAAKVEVDVVSLDDPGYPLLNALLRDGIVLHEGGTPCRSVVAHPRPSPGGDGPARLGKDERLLPLRD